MTHRGRRTVFLVGLVLVSPIVTWAAAAEIWWVYQGRKRFRP